jgi:2-amino-4-hydroxy-6-hydroxymethyldihydropteridine diphosphokinase
MYVTHQPPFLNAVAELRTSLGPLELLGALQSIEKDLGRVTKAERYGPRPIDLDIILYGTDVVNLENSLLTIPHPRLSERAFVLRPLCDIDGSVAIPNQKQSRGSEATSLPPTALQLLNELEPDCVDHPRGICTGMTRVTPLQHATSSVIEWTDQPKTMGIVNATPDSFSDGGQISSTSEALSLVDRFVEHGFNIIDVCMRYTFELKTVAQLECIADDINILCG